VRIIVEEWLGKQLVDVFIATPTGPVEGIEPSRPTTVAMTALLIEEAPVWSAHPSLMLNKNQLTSQRQGHRGQPEHRQPHC
jgi:hypothetical protein